MSQALWHQGILQNVLSFPNIIFFKQTDTIYSVLEWD